MIHIILFEPEHPGNVGAIARVMKNFGFTQLVLINPKCEINEECRQRAVHAQDVLKNAYVIKDTKLSGYDILIGTTGKLGKDYNMTRTPVAIEDIVSRLQQTDMKNTKIALVIGRESSGLLNEELERCDFITHIPTDSSYPILNISHAVGILLYELHKITCEPLEKVFVPAKRAEKEQALKYVDEILDKMEFQTEEKKETQRQLWKKLVTKSFLTKREIFAFLGFLKKIDEKME